MTDHHAASSRIAPYVGLTSRPVVGGWLDIPAGSSAAPERRNSVHPGQILDGFPKAVESAGHGCQDDHAGQRHHGDRRPEDAPRAEVLRLHRDPLVSFATIPLAVVAAIGHRSFSVSSGLRRTKASAALIPHRPLSESSRRDQIRSSDGGVESRHAAKVAQQQSAGMTGGRRAKFPAIAEVTTSAGVAPGPSEAFPLTPEP